MIACEKLKVQVKDASFNSVMLCLIHRERIVEYRSPVGVVASDEIICVSIMLSLVVPVVYPFVPRAHNIVQRELVLVLEIAVLIVLLFTADAVDYPRIKKIVFVVSFRLLLRKLSIRS
jgi:hypothetical protein